MLSDRNLSRRHRVERTRQGGIGNRRRLRIPCGLFTWEEHTMRSISTLRGDAGETSLAGGLRVSKASARVDAYGTIDELISSLGVTRAACTDIELATLTKTIQQDLFKIGSSLA